MAGLHELVEDRARDDADAVAVVCCAQRLTYGELDARASLLAQRLRALGVGGVGLEDLVGVHVGRGVGLPVALLGVLKAGAAFVPLAAELPPARLAALLGDTRAAAVVTTARLRGAVPADVPTVLLDAGTLPRDTPAQRGATAADNRDKPAQRGVPATENRDRPAQRGVDAANAAYVIHTSGSTGAPKGVLVPHGAAVEHIRSVVDLYGLGPSDTVLQLAGESFDVAVEQLFAGLAAGATVLLRDDRPWGPAEVLDVLRAGEVTVADLPTALFCELTTTETADTRCRNTGHTLSKPRTRAGLGNVRLLLVGGEALSSAALMRWLDAAGEDDPQVWNAYGPTETVMTATVARCTAATVGSGSAPIGDRVGPRTLAVLDAVGDPADTGELFIGGTALARGYLDRPDLTAERFVPDPDGAPGARRYRTGDRVRVGTPETGGLEFLGRVDDQVKVRGYRVEPGEIEHVLAAHPGIAQAAVVADGDRLAAYLVADGGGGQPGLGELREWLAARLPGWMVPGTWLWLDRLPVRPSGKIDRAALAGAGGERVAAPVTEAPRTERERRLAEAFQSVLGLTDVGAHDDFLELGGTSLLAARVLAEVRAELGVALPLHIMYEARTPASLATAVAAADPSVAVLPPVTHRDGGPVEAPLSLMQEQIWFLEQLQPGNIAYNAPTTFRLHGHVDVAVLERAVTEIVRRHEILRTTVHSRDGRPVQRVEAPYPVRVPVVDLRGFDDPHAESERMVAGEIRTAFTLTELPLLRWTLLRLADEEWELVLVEHHLVHDGWTFALLVGELTRLYDAFLAGEPSPLPEPTLQYADFARWQHEVIDSEPMAAQLRYWTEKLADAPDGLDLPYERQRADRSDIVGATCRVELPAELCEAAREFSRREGVTLFVTMLSAYLATLHRYTGQEELCVGSAYGNRALAGTQDLPGMFVNPVVLRCAAAGRSTFRELLASTKAVTIDAQANQEYPFVRLVQALAPPRLPGRNPLFQAMFNFDDAPIARMNFTGARGGVLERFNGTAKLDLGVLVIPRAERQVGVPAHERDRRITMVWEYRSDLLSAATVQRLTESYATVLAAALADPAQRVADLPTGEPAAREWKSRLGPAFPLTSGFTRGDPLAKAVHVPGGETLTYAALDRRANQVAHLLRDGGVRTGDVVGIGMDRGVDMVVAVLGVLKAGAAYLPLDPAYPAHRLDQALTDANAAALLVSRNWGQSTSFCSRVFLDDAAGRPDTDPGIAVDPDQAAYLIYTSGSTGRPKCVEISRRALVDKYLAWEQEYRLRADDGPRTHLQLAAFPFDVCTGDLVRALLSGGRLVIPDRDATLDPAALLATMRDNGVDCVELLPSVARLLVDHVLDMGASLDFLRLVAVGGEAWTPTEFERLRAACGPDTRVLNVYGVTEATIGNTVHEPADTPSTGTLPIGRPLPGVEALVRDALLRPVGPGVVGEIVLGGSGLATGYRGRPDLTAERFVPHPTVAGARLYRTGDRGRHLADGSIEYLGRGDQQVKIRGFRVELGEIESVLRAHPDVLDAVVAAPGDATTRRLVAYVVTGAPDLESVRRFVRDRLPEHMVPGSYVVLDALPRTTSGKLDRGALPMPDGAPADTGEVFVEPRPGTEDRVAAIWRRVLRVERVGARDEFFQLGGHSLLAAQVSAQVRAELGVDLAVRDLLAGPTVEALARHLDGVLARGTPDAPEPALVAVRRADYRMAESDFDGAGSTS